MYILYISVHTYMHICKRSGLLGPRVCEGSVLKDNSKVFSQGFHQSTFMSDPVD